MSIWTCRSQGKKYSVTASSESEAARLLVTEYRIDPRKLDYLVQEEEQEVKTKIVEQHEMWFIATVGRRDYTIPASDELEALHVLGTHGIDMRKVRNVRRK